MVACGGRGSEGGGEGGEGGEESRDIAEECNDSNPTRRETPFRLPTPSKCSHNVCTAGSV